MTVGRLDELQAKVGVLFAVPDGRRIEIEFVVDTGFAGSLTLPYDAVMALSLPFVQEIDANLADDKSIGVDVHLATILWDGREVEVPVLAMGKRPLLGTTLLAGKELVIQFIENGLVSIEDA